jgi:cell division septum initiation protein DivIVA
MSSPESDRNRFVALPFTVVRKGYAQDEVRNYFDRFDAELRVTATDRDAAAAQARNLASQLEDARDEIDRLSVPPTTAEGMSDRISRMLRLASDEASEVRALAQAEAAEMVSIAEQQATEMRGKYESLLAETKEKREALEIEFEQTLANARTESAKIIEAAQAEADRLGKEADAKRKATQQDFEVTMSERRTKLTRAMEELEATSRAEAAQRIKDATDESNRLITSATQTSERKIAHAKELAEEMRVLRGRVLAQLLGIRGQLDSVPAMLAAVNRESELLDGVPDQRKSIGGNTKSVTGSRTKAIPEFSAQDDDIVDEERENADITH